MFDPDSISSNKVCLMIECSDVLMVKVELGAFSSDDVCLSVTHQHQ